MESNQMLWDMLKSHIGHQVCIAAYGDTDDPMAKIYTVAAREK